MELEQHFKQFLQNISLNKSRLSQIESAITTWKTLLENDKEIKLVYKDFYPQGSYATNTAIRPSNGDEFDVDAVLVVDCQYKDSKEFYNWILERIKSNEAYKDRIKPKERCIRILYSGDFHVDIVPAKSTYGDSIYIPSKSEGDWIKTNPKGFTKWCEKIERKHKDFPSITKILKYWRDEKVGDNTAPKSILLTTLIGQSMSTEASCAGTLISTLENLMETLDNLIEESGSDGSIEVWNPSLEGENLARDWDVSKCSIFKKKVANLLNNAKEAYEEEDEEKSIAKWQTIFGKSKFPSILSEGATMAKKIAAGLVSVSATGRLNTQNNGLPIKEHRFFGGGM
jgi:hypothetical protein